MLYYRFHPARKLANEYELFSWLYSLQHYRIEWITASLDWKREQYQKAIEFLPASSDGGLECYLKKKAHVLPLLSDAKWLSKRRPSIKVGRKTAPETSSPLAEHSNHSIFSNRCPMKPVSNPSYSAIRLYICVSVHAGVLGRNKSQVGFTDGEKYTSGEKIRGCCWLYTRKVILHTWVTKTDMWKMDWAKCSQSSDYVFKEYNWKPWVGLSLTNFPPLQPKKKSSAVPMGRWGGGGYYE